MTKAERSKLIAATVKKYRLDQAAAQVLARLNGDEILTLFKGIEDWIAAEMYDETAEEGCC